jgi:hypothetical protein
MTKPTARMQVLAPLSSPDWSPISESYGMPWDNATALVDRLIAETRAAAYREAAERLLAHPGPHTDTLQPDAPGYWWDTRDRDAAAVLLLQWDNEIHPT